jgi:xylulokinase
MSTRDLLLGIDIGNSHAKAVLLTPEGALVAQAQAAHPTRHPRPGWAEQDPDDWWGSVVASTRGALAQAEGSVRAIGVSGQGCAVTLLDGEGRALHPAILAMDSRSEPQCEQLRACCAEPILRLNGKSPAPYNADPTLMWLTEHRPELIEAARCSLTTTGYITWRLSRRAVMNRSDASILFAYDLARNDWSPELVAAFGLPSRLYPEVARCSEVVGGLSPEAALALGLPAGVPVVAGGEDTSSAGLASGAVRPGMVFLSLGTAGTVYKAEAAPVVHPQLLTFEHVLDGQYLVGGSMAAHGAALAWCRQWLGEGLDFPALTALAATSEPGAGNLWFLPYLSGELQPINDGNARGVFFGLSMSTGRAELVRAVLEGTAYAIAHNLVLAETVGTPVRELRAVGGPTRSDIWCQIIADVCGRSLGVLGEGFTAPYGTALLAGAGVGLVADPAALAEAVCAVERSFVPDPARHDTYRARFDIYRRLYPQLRELYAEVAHL